MPGVQASTASAFRSRNSCITRAGIFSAASAMKVPSSLCSSSANWRASKTSWVIGNRGGSVTDGAGGKRCAEANDLRMEAKIFEWEAVI